MATSKTELIFPPHIISDLANLRGHAWQDLVITISRANDSSIEQAAFVLMMVHLNNCASCNSGSHRSVQGCTICSQYSIKHFNRSDEELLQSFETAKLDILQYSKQKCIVTQKPK